MFVLFCVTDLDGMARLVQETHVSVPGCFFPYDDGWDKIRPFVTKGT